MLVVNTNKIIIKQGLEVLDDTVLNDSPFKDSGLGPVWEADAGKNYSVTSEELLCAAC